MACTACTCSGAGPLRQWTAALSPGWPLRNGFLWAEMLFWRSCQDVFTVRCLLAALPLNAATHKRLLFKPNSADPRCIQTPRSRHFWKVSRFRFARLRQSSSHSQGKSLGTIYQAFYFILPKVLKLTYYSISLWPVCLLLSSFHRQPPGIYMIYTSSLRCSPVCTQSNIPEE